MTPVKDADVDFASALMPTDDGLPAGIADRLAIRSLPEILRDARAEGRDLTDPAIAELIPETDFLSFCRHHDLMRDAASQLGSGEKSYKVLIKGGLFQSAMLNFLLYEEGEPEPPTRALVPIAELHRPHVTGCKTSYAVRYSESGRAGLKLFARGVGAGGGLSLTMTFQRTISADDPCIRVTVPIVYVMTPWANPDSGKEIGVIAVTDVFANDCVRVPIADGEVGHPCSALAADYSAQLAAHQKRGAKAAEGLSYNITGPGGPTDDMWDVEQSRSFSLKWGEFFEMKSQFTRQYSYVYTLAGGSSYMGFRESPDSEAFFWTWKTP